MKLLFIILIFSTVFFAYDNYIKENNKENYERIKKEQQSYNKEKEYLKYKEKLEEENRKLEEDGFCSCNNN